MKASELRIGNFIKISNTITKVEGFSEWDNIVQSSNFAERKINEFEPIPITEEWLLKFGFGNITEQCAFKSINIKTFCKSFTVKGCNEQQTIFIELGTRGWTFKRVGYPLYNYVHQLQNLYFALTGDELKFNN